ncbi:MAG: hypothetical protein K2Y21_11660 [Phycisphaerales bacterium]|nr:hypothetical protein [Phycisphaerales bacterium]
MKIRNAMTVLAAAGILGTLAACATPSGNTTADKQNNTLSMRDATLTRLYKEKPEAKAAIDNGAGYGVFSTIAMGAVVGGSNGYGVVEDKSGKRTYMRMASGGLNLGVSATETKLVLVFKDKATLDKFTSSTFEWGSSAAAGAKGDKSGGMNEEAGKMTRDITVYQLTDTGFALTANLAGTKFWPEKGMN